MKKKTKKDKKILVVVLCFIVFILGIIIGFLLKTILIKEDPINDEKPNYYYIEPVLKEYMSVDNKTIYLYNLNELNLNINNNRITLKDFIKNNNDDLETSFIELEKYLNVKTKLNDGGTIIYETKDNKLFNQDLTIIKCNTTDGNKDLYLGIYYNTTDAFKSGACGKNFFDDVDFIRTYTITKIKRVKENLYKITITDGKEETTIERSLSDDSRAILKENAKFNFYFNNKYGELIKENIEYIFENCDLTGVVPVK